MNKGKRYDLQYLCTNWLFVNEHLNDPLQVYDRCDVESQRFRNYLWDREFPEAKFIYGLKFGEFQGWSVITAAHIAVQVDDLVYDWTARQFDPQAPVPKISTVEEFRTEWAPIPDRRTS